MTDYTGMFIGGPKDGEFMRHESPFLQIPIYEPQDWVPYWVETAQPTVFKVKRFHHMIGLRGQLEIDFWVDRDEFKDVGEVLRHVFKVYVDAVKKEDEE